MNFDISHLLDSWEYRPGQVLVRRVHGKDGREKIQLRLDLGLLQMEATGRPDGKRPFGYASLLEYYQARLDKHRASHGGDDSDFLLDGEDCSRLQQEALQYHNRYICLLQMDDYEGVLRDTQHNLELFDLVAQYAANAELAWSLQQFRPQLLLINIRALAALALESGKLNQAIKIIEVGLQALCQFYQHAERPDLLEHSVEIASLTRWLEELQAQRPLTRRERLERDLAEALRTENYEKAAQLRDALRKLNSGAQSRRKR